ncbi:MAG: epimerase [Verrucomicrobiales bacterium]|nr:epimerase [Verrucomicrobiales bacterium]
MGICISEFEQQVKIPTNDLENVGAQCEALGDLLEGRHLFVTGGTGFFGKWLVESLLFINKKQNLNIKVSVLSRNPAQFLAVMPHLKGESALQLIEGDLNSLRALQLNQTIDYLIHAATEASAKLNAEEPVTMARTACLGTEYVLEFALRHKVRRFLLTSSGAVYGKQPPEIANVEETYMGGPDLLDAGSAYAEGKRFAETLCACYSKQYGIDCLIARCFAFVGPHLPLDAHFAIGNFIRDATSSGRIVVSGDGTPYRSYMYASDLVVWLLTILTRGSNCRAYNVGSPMSYRIKEIAEIISSAEGGCEIEIKSKPVAGALVQRYVPNVQRAQSELGLAVRVPIQNAVQKTLEWVQKQKI